MAKKAAKLNDVISIWSPKEAALYFDRVFPFDFSHALMQRHGATQKINLNSVPLGKESVFDGDVIKSLLKNTIEPELIYARYSALMLISSMLIFAKRGNQHPDQFLDQLGPTLEAVAEAAEIDTTEIIKHVKASDYDRAGHINMQKALSLAFDIGFDNAPMWVGEDFSSKFKSQAKGNESQEHFMAVISGLRLVDPARLSWDQVIEFRKDEAARTALSDLRLFFIDELSNKDPLYAQDKLNSLMSKAEKAAKLWGFDTINKSFSAIFSKQSLAATGVTGVTALLGGLSPNLAALSGAVVSAGSVALEFSKVLVDANKNFVDSPVRYLTRVKKLGR